MADQTGNNLKAGVYIALLRGINVGGKNSLPMKALAGMFEKAGCQSVETLIQSGNVLFQAEPELAHRIPWLIPRAIQRVFKMNIPLTVRNAVEMEKIAKGNPFINKRVNRDQLYVAFLSFYPTKTQAATLDPRHSPPDRFQFKGSEIFLHLRNGAGKTKLTNSYFDSKLGCVSTIRNWKTVLKLQKMTARG